MTRQIDMGPFKQTIDDALSVRKAAFNIFTTCLERYPDSINIAQFMPVLSSALGDVEDIQLQAHQVLVSLCQKYPKETFAAVEMFVDPLTKTIGKKYGSKSGTELERVKEWIKSAVKAAFALARYTDANK